jgi:hypothetical protein
MSNQPGKEDAGRDPNNGATSLNSRSRQATRRDRPISPLHRVDEYCQLPRRRRPVCIDEGDQVGPAPIERLTDHTSFAQFGESVDLDSGVFDRMVCDDFGSGVITVVEGNDEPHVRMRELTSKRLECRSDPVGLVVGGDDEVESDLISPSRPAFKGFHARSACTSQTSHFLGGLIPV